MARTLDIEDISKMHRRELRANALQYCAERMVYRITHDFRNPNNHDWALAVFYEHEARRLRRMNNARRYGGRE